MATHSSTPGSSVLGILPGKSHGRRSLVGCNPWGHKELDTTERLHFHLSLSCIGEGNGNPLRCSCLENPRDRGAWWAAVYGVAQSWTWLNWLISRSSTHIILEVTPSEAPLYLASSFPSGRTSDYTRDKTLVRLSVDTSFHLVKCLNPSQILT